MAVNTSLNAFSFIKVTPRGSSDPVAINPAHIVTVRPSPGFNGSVGSSISLTGPNSARVESDLTVDQVIALATPTV